MESAETILEKYIKNNDVSEKATNGDAFNRYAYAGQLSTFFEKAITYKNQAENQGRIDTKIKSRQFDDEIESYIYNLTNEEIAKRILLDKFTFVVKEIAANIFRYVAWDVNRFSA